jgi:hypothetical protein
MTDLGHPNAGRPGSLRGKDAMLEPGFGSMSLISGINKPLFRSNVKQRFVFLKNERS